MKEPPLFVLGALFALLCCVFFFAFALFIEGRMAVSELKSLKKQAVEINAAEWQIDPESGHTHFIWKENETTE